MKVIYRRSAGTLAVWLCVLAPGMLSAVPATAAPAAAAATAAPQALDCLIEPERSADVAASAAGTLDTVLVERGQSVKKGQLLATLTSQVERASLEASRQRASSQEEINAAVAAVDIAQTRLTRVRRLVDLGYGSTQDLDQARGDAEIAAHRLGQAKENREVALREQTVAVQQLAAREVRSPIAGVIADRLLQPGERVDGRPLFRVLALDQLKVEVVAPATMFGAVMEGATVTVQPEVLRATPHEAKVVQVDRFIDPASGTFRMRLSLPNRGGAVPAGVRCRVDLVDKTASSR